VSLLDMQASLLNSAKKETPGEIFLCPARAQLFANT